MRHTMHLRPGVAKQPNLELKTRPKQLLGYLPLVIALPETSFWSSADVNPMKNDWVNAMSWQFLVALSPLSVYTTICIRERNWRGRHSMIDLPGNIKEEVTLYCWPPVWLVWNLLYDNRRLFFFGLSRFWTEAQNKESLKWLYSVCWLL